MPTSKVVARRIVDRRVLHLIKMWLECPWKKPMNGGGRHARPRLGQAAWHPAKVHPFTAIGESLHAPVCAGWKKLGLEHSLGTRIVNYADDLVILCRKSTANEALQRLREIMAAEAHGERGEDTNLQGAGGESTSWDTRLGGCTQREPERPPGQRHQRKASGAWSRKVHVLTTSGYLQETTELVIG